VWPVGDGFFGVPQAEGVATVRVQMHFHRKVCLLQRNVLGECLIHTIDVIILDLQKAISGSAYVREMAAKPSSARLKRSTPSAQISRGSDVSSTSSVSSLSDSQGGAKITR
jgi:hypothetical protein